MYSREMENPYEMILAVLTKVLDGMEAGCF